MIQPTLSALLTDGEVEYLCELITPKEIKLYFQKNPAAFAELQSGFRAKALTDQRAIDLIVRNRNKNFVATFLNSFIETCRKDIHNQIVSFRETCATADEAMIQALAGSHIFFDHVDLYFKIEESVVSEEYISLIKAAVTLLNKKVAEIDSERSSNKELADSLENIQCELAKEREEHAHVQENLVGDNHTLQQGLEYARNELSKATAEIDKMRADLDWLHWLREYADVPQETDVDGKYQHSSLCQIVLDRRAEPRPKRFADLCDDRLTSFQIDTTIPYGAENRDLIYRNGDDPSTEGFWGIWHWSVTQNRDKPEKEYIKSKFDHRMVPIDIFVLPGCTGVEDIVKQLSEGVSAKSIGRKSLISMPVVDDQYSGLLCCEDNFDIQNGIARLKPSVLTLPLFSVHIGSTLTLRDKIFCRRLALGLPPKVVRVKNPLAFVKEIILTRANFCISNHHDFNETDAQRYFEYLRSLETATLYDDVAKSYGCSIEEAQKYVEEFIEVASNSLSSSDVSIDLLAGVIEKNNTLMSICKNMLSEEWTIENEEQIYAARQVLKGINEVAEQQHQNVTELEMQQDALRQQMKILQSEITAKEALASAVEEKVANRIAKARQNAADLISDLAFTSPVSVQGSGRSGTALSVFVRPVNASEISATITDISDFEDSLAENLECCGYSEERSAALSQILSFCIDRHMPIVCDSNPEIIADCLAAMFGLNGATSIHISTGESCCIDLCDFLRQRKNTASHQVYLINGALDAYSPNVFNGILQNVCNLDRCILIFSCEGTPIEALPPAIWSRTIFIDGDIDLVHLPQDNLSAFEAKFDFCQELSQDKLKEKRKQLKPFTQIISNRALLNYACFMAFINSSIQSDPCILTQLLLNAKADGNLENLLEQFEKNEISIEKNELSKYLWGVV